MSSLDSVQQASQAQFDRQSARYGKSHILADVSDVEAAFHWITQPPQATALDIATGGGHTGLCLASRGYRVTLADISAAMLENAQKLATERSLTVETRQHPAEDMPYPEASFDLVSSRVAPHHFSSPEKFVSESARVLKPGGFFLLIDGSVYDNELEAEAWLHQVEKLRDPSHHQLLSPKAWIALCEKAGLTIKHHALLELKQPDLNWYFETAATSPENRAAVLTLVEQAPASVKKLYKLTQEDKKIVWWWPRLTLVAEKL
jgi:ubiquinone/menaquinone biosynthesis C-methylase UbiE